MRTWRTNREGDRVFLAARNVLMPALLNAGPTDCPRRPGEPESAGAPVISMRAGMRS